MLSTQLVEQQPWTRPWWQYSKGSGPVLFYIAVVHVLALIGLFLFPLPSLPILTTALAFASRGNV